MPRTWRSVKTSERSAKSASTSRRPAALSALAGSERPRWLSARKLMSRHITGPGWLRLALLAVGVDHRVARRGRSGDAAHVESGVVDQLEVGTAIANRQLLGEVPVRDQRANAQLLDAFGILDAAGLEQREEELGAGVVRAASRSGAPSRSARAAGGARCSRAPPRAAGWWSAGCRADRPAPCPCAPDSGRRRR